MNENQEIFTADQFRQQALELSQAVAELQRRDAVTIDPQDPFDNETEFHEYAEDYGEIVPQIRIPGCHIPLKPNRRERSRIRHYHNTVGGALLLHFVVSNALAIGLMMLVTALLYGIDTVRAGGTLPADYDLRAETLLYDGATMTAVNLLIFGLVNAVTALIGLRVTKIRPASLFRTKGFTIWHAAAYICIIITIQCTMGYAADFLTDMLSSVGIEPYEADFETLPEIKCTILSVIYSILIAPVTEELLMRGFVLKNLSRVSQRFGIFMSAFLFGVWHENLGQFLLAFVGGIFFGYLAVKHDSLLPSIVCHMFVNGVAELFSICDTYGWYDLYDVLDMIYMGVAAFGVILLVVMFIRERLPKTVPAQTERGLRITLTSPLLLIAIAAHVGAAVYYTLYE